MTVIGNRFTPPFAGRRPDGPTPAPPGPDLHFLAASNVGGRVNVTLAQRDTSTIDLLAIDWGDGTRDELAAWSAAHSYTAPGVYEIRAIARSNTRRESLNSIRVSVPEIQSIPDPVADFTVAPDPPVAGELTTFDGSPSTPDEHITEYRWELIGLGEGFGKVITHTFAAPGVQQARLTVRLADGRNNIRTRGLVVQPPPEDT